MAPFLLQTFLLFFALTSASWALSLERTVCAFSAFKDTAKHLAKKLDSKPENYTRESVIDQIEKWNAQVGSSWSPSRLPQSDVHLTDEKYVYRYAQYCALSYCETQQDSQSISGIKTPKLALEDFTILHWVENLQRFHYYIAINKRQNAITVVFRGTQNTANWFTDADARMVPVNTTVFPSAPEEAEVHSGFQWAVRKLVHPVHGPSMPELLQGVVKAYPGMDVVITGHSLGGALAALITLHIVESTDIPVRALFTYGQPIFGNGVFADHFTARFPPSAYIRAVSSDDVIPWMNFHESKTSPRKSFRHSVGAREVYFPDPDKPVMRVCDWTERDMCSATVSCLRRGWNHHSVLGGFWISKRICLLGR